MCAARRGEGPMTDCDRCKGEGYVCCECGRIDCIHLGAAMTCPDCDGEGTATDD